MRRRVEDGRTHKSVACSRVTWGIEVYQMVQVLIVPSLYGSPSRRLAFCLQRAFGNWSIPPGHHVLEELLNGFPYTIFGVWFSSVEFLILESLTG